MPRQLPRGADAAAGAHRWRAGRFAHRHQGGAPAVGWAQLPDPFPQPGTVPLSTTLTNTAGAGPADLELGALPQGSAHLLLTFVCLGGGDGGVSDATGRLLIGGPCRRDLEQARQGTTIGDLTGLAEPTGRLRLTVADGAPWRLYVAAY